MSGPAADAALPDRAALGLTSAEAAARLRADGPNELPTAKKRSLARQARDVLREPMLLLLLGAGIVNFALADPLDGLLLFAGVLVVVGISLYQEHKTENALAALRELAAPRALVLRDGARVRVPGREVVRGDCLVLREGDRIAADAALVECANLAVDESMLTGESVPVRKAAATTAPDMGPPGGEGTPWVFSGTLAVRGQGLALVRATGPASELGRIGASLRTIETGRTRLQREIDRLVRRLAVLGLGAAGLVWLVYGLTRGGWLAGLLAGIATAMSMLPEEFPVVLTIFLALGAWRLARKNVLTRRSPVIETLGSATALCVDKTGTLTMNRMTVRELIVDGATFRVGEDPLPEPFRAIAEFAVLASPLDPFDPMDTAFRALGDRHLAGTVHHHPDWTLVREYPLSERLLALSHAWSPPAGDRFVVAAKGAPEAIAELCRLEPARRDALLAHVEAATRGGGRVLGVARAYASRAEGLPEDQRDLSFELLGLAGLQDPVRPGVAAAVAECVGAGVRTLMITGDYPGTALAIAREIGLPHAAGCITGPELRAMSDADLADRIRNVSVFARMVPEQKLRLIRALKANGEVVAMTGDGVNDAPALRAADIGIAMGARGTDVAREAAALVILDDDFSSIVGGVRQGRGIFANLRKAMSYILAVHVPIAGMALIPVFVGHWPLVLLPLQIAFLEFIIDPACSIVFEAEAVDPDIMRAPPRAPDAPMFSPGVLAIGVLQGASVLAAVLGVYGWAIASRRPDEVVRTLAFGALVVGNLALILVNRSWRLSIWSSLWRRPNPTLPWILGLTLALLAVLVTVPAVRVAFHLGPITWPDAGVVLLAGLAGVAWFEIYKVVAAWRERRGVRARVGAS